MYHKYTVHTRSYKITQDHTSIYTYLWLSALISKKNVLFLTPPTVRFFSLRYQTLFPFLCRSLIYLNLIVGHPYSPLSVGSNPHFATISTPDPFSPLQGKNYSILTCFSIFFQLFKPALQKTQLKNRLNKNFQAPTIHIIHHPTTTPLHHPTHGPRGHQAAPNPNFACIASVKLEAAACEAAAAVKGSMP